jgi:hypothetical protein
MIGDPTAPMQDARPTLVSHLERLEKNISCLDTITYNFSNSIEGAAPKDVEKTPEPTYNGIYEMVECLNRRMEAINSKLDLLKDMVG